MSSLINKGSSFKPKAGGRRRGGGAAGALAVRDTTASVTSARSSLEPSATPQPDLLARQITPAPGLPTPETSQIQSDASTRTEGVPAIQSRAPDGVPSITVQKPTALAPASIPSITRQDGAIPSISTGVTRGRSPSANVELLGAKRRRIDTGDFPARTASPPAPVQPPRAPADDDEIPTIQVAKTPPGKVAKTKASEKGKQKAKDGVVDYETPDVPEGEPPASTPAPKRRQTRPGVAPLLMASISGPKPRAKGTRRNQWQITTPGDLAAVRHRDLGVVDQPMEDAEAQDLDPSMFTGTKLRKVRKDKGIKKGPRVEIREDDDEDEEDDESPPAVNGSRSTRTRPSRAEKEALAAAATRGRTIAPQPGPTPPPTADATEEGEPDEEAELTADTGVTARLRNAQKRRAKMLARKGATSRAAGIDTAAAIDDAVAQSVEGGAKSRRKGPLFRVQAQEARPRSRSRRSESVSSQSTEVTEITEGGTTVKRKGRRYKRAATPPGNETVFIAEKVTPIFSLLGRDTENRVGMRSNTEMLMRTMDWKQIKRDNDEKMRAMAIAKGNRKTNDFDVINRTGTPVFDVKPTTPTTPNSNAEEGDEEAEEDPDAAADELDSIVKQRAKHFGPQNQGMVLQIVNGQHRMVPAATAYRSAADEIDAQAEEMEPVEESELKKPKFNVHTFIKWKRRDPLERVAVTSRWNDEETEKFYEALRCCGVDFGSMAEWFPNRIRRSIKRKFNIEERVNPERINETLDAHMMMVASGSGEGRDDGTGWDMSQFHANGAGYNLRDPKEVEEELAKIRKEREVEIEAARKEFEAERANQREAGVESSEEEEDEEEEEEEEDLGDVVGRVQREMMEKKRKEREAAAALDSGGEEDEEEEYEDEEVMPTVEADDEGQLASEDENADWDDE